MTVRTYFQKSRAAKEGKGTSGEFTDRLDTLDRLENTGKMNLASYGTFKRSLLVQEDLHVTKSPSHASALKV